MKGSSDEIIQEHGGDIIRSAGRKDCYSKVYTSKGPRDRRVRLSAHTAIQFYDVQDRLGYDRPSKALDWLIQKAKDAINELPRRNTMNTDIVAADSSPDDYNPYSTETAALDQQSYHFAGSSSFRDQTEQMNSLNFPVFSDDQVMKGFPETFQRMETTWNHGHENIGSFLTNSGQAFSQQELNYSSSFQLPDERELQFNLPVHGSDHHHHQYSAAHGYRSSDSSGRFSLGFSFPAGNDEEKNRW